MSDPNTPVDLVDEAVDESFPASDPPASTGLHAGGPAPLGPPSPRTSGTTDTRDLETTRSDFGVGEAIQRVERAMTASRMKVFAQIDQAAEARAVGLAMRPAVLLLFGNPAAGTALMVARPTVAIDLPLKALLWEDERGDTWLTTNTPQLLVRRHGLDPALAAKLAPAMVALQKAVRR